jgi:hypothetical protein
MLAPHPQVISRFGFGILSLVSVSVIHPPFISSFLNE